MRIGRTACLGLLAVLLSRTGPAGAQTPPPEPGAAHVVPMTGVGTILGRIVTDSDGSDAGPLVDVIVDPGGVPKAGVIDVGGFLGVGARRVAIGWSLLHFVPGPGGTRIGMDLTIAAAAAAPEAQGWDGYPVVVDRVEK